MATSRIWAWTKECSIKVVQNASHRIFENPWIESLNRCLEDLPAFENTCEPYFSNDRLQFLLGNAPINQLPWLPIPSNSWWSSLRSQSFWTTYGPRDVGTIWPPANCQWFHGINGYKWHIQCFSALCNFDSLSLTMFNHKNCQLRYHVRFLLHMSPEGFSGFFCSTHW